MGGTGGKLGRKIAFSYVIFFTVVLVSADLYISKKLETRGESELRKSLIAFAKTFEQTLTPSLIQSRDLPRIYALTKALGEASGLRITVTDPKGTVLGDSERTFEEVPEMEDHSQRPEIKWALRGEIGSSMRYSTTLRTGMMYLALPLTETGNIVGALRVSLSLQSANDIVYSVRRPIWAALIAGIGCVILLGAILSGSLTKRIRSVTRIALLYSRGNFSERIPLKSNDELNILSKAMNQMASALEKRLSEIEREKAKLSAIVRNMAEGVIAVSRSRKILMLNPSAEKIFGISGQVSVGKLLIEVIRSRKIDETVSLAIEKQSLLSQDLVLATPKEKHLRVNAVGISSSESEICGFLVVYDVTEMRRLEKMRQDFVANVSHELRTPLTSIKGFVETLLSGVFHNPVQSEKFLKIINENTERLHRLIVNLLDLSKIESQKNPLQPEPLNLSAELEKILPMFASPIREKNLSVENRLPAAALPEIRADKDKLHQVFVNLLDNAVKFNKTNGRIVIDARLLEGKIQVSVRDTGIGIPKDAVGRIFERFFTVDKARTREFGGTGLGLSIVKHIVEAHGGSVSCESEPETGTTVAFTLPI
ncbi:MAG TPA: ATP-binding protein [Candidatus Omnitrophota bacterium]|nr:ATP-binding protein [Candidatus Omnitrophota bacterium]